MANGGVIPEVLRLTLTQKLMLIPALQPFVPYVVNFCVYSFGLSKVFGNETQPTAQEYKDFWLAEHHNHGENVIAKINLYHHERKMYRDQWVGALQEMENPLHFIFGKRDRLYPEDFPDTFRSTFPKATIDVIDVGHFVFFEAPQETMKSYKAFLQKNI